MWATVSEKRRSVRASVAIVGAGAVGLAAALQLGRAGVRGVVVLDRHPAPGMGATGRANGGVRAQFFSRVNVEFSEFTIHELASLDAATGGVVGLRRIGYLLMTGEEARATMLARAVELQHSLGVR